VIITRTPLRLSLLGGGTDYPDWYLKHGGMTVGAALNKYTYVTVKRLPRLFKHRIRVAYSKVELCYYPSQIKHPAVRECLSYMNIKSGIEISVVSDLPARSGTGSSSSFVVGLLMALSAYKDGSRMTARELAEHAVSVEYGGLGEHVGVQDQYTAAYGGLCRISCTPMNNGTPFGSVQLDSIPISPERLGELRKNLVMYYTNSQRTAHEILPEQMKRTADGDNTAALEALHTLAWKGYEVLANPKRQLDELGDLLGRGWEIKKRLSSKVSTPVIDDLYTKALVAGAIGGKLMGAGSGGFLLLYVHPDKQAAVSAALQLPQVPVGFDFGGSKVIFDSGED
jgi:D-glycero-alpha-D-manno-heptose-7-phosphate kinase